MASAGRPVLRTYWSAIYTLGVLYYFSRKTPPFQRPSSDAHMPHADRTSRLAKLATSLTRDPFTSKDESGQRATTRPSSICPKKKNQKGKYSTQENPTAL